jgi:hypothetical protein
LPRCAKSWRGLELMDRYDDLREEAIRVGGYQNPEWRAYCEKHGSDYSHRGVDFFA